MNNHIKPENLKNNNPFNDVANKGRGPQGVDKAPGEETADSTENVIWETQKGQGKEDGDPSLQTDQPIEQE